MAEMIYSALDLWRPGQGQGLTNILPTSADTDRIHFTIIKMFRYKDIILKDLECRIC